MGIIQEIIKSQSKSNQGGPKQASKDHRRTMEPGGHNPSEDLSDLNKKGRNVTPTGSHASLMSKSTAIGQLENQQ